VIVLFLYASGTGTAAEDQPEKSRRTASMRRMMPVRPI
jgi:cytochrome c556